MIGLGEKVKMKVKGFSEFLNSLGSWFAKTGRKLNKKLNCRLQSLVRFDAMLRFRVAYFLALGHRLFLSLVYGTYNPRIRFGLGITTGLLFWFAVIAILKLIFDF